MRSLEAMILRELRQIENNPKIKQKDIMEWSTGEVKTEKGEKLVHLTLSELGGQPINVSYKPEK
jgi:hypothetical protein